VLVVHEAHRRAERAWVTPQHLTDEVLIAVPAGIERPDV
jgi:hypothetical protein